MIHTRAVQQGLEELLHGRPSDRGKNSPVGIRCAVVRWLIPLPRVDLDKNQVQMTLRSGEIASLATSMTLSDFTKGKRVDGVVQNVTEYGVFIQVNGSDAKGLCHRSEVTCIFFGGDPLLTTLSWQTLMAHQPMRC